MNITVLELPVRELVSGYVERPDGGAVLAWDGRLNARSEYQREFVYPPKQQELVVDSILHDYPLGVFYFAPTPEGGYEVLDGQQRIISICRYARGAFSVPWGQGAEQRDCDYANLDPADRERFDDYRLRVFVCDGSDGEKMAWFRRINVAGLVLTDQELRNATFHGPFVTDARRMFSKPNAPVLRHYGFLFAGKPIRQDVLETALLWWSRTQGLPDNLDDAHRIDTVMSRHRDDPDARPLFEYIQHVFAWVAKTFPRHYTDNRHENMRGVDWGILYDRFGDATLDPEGLETRVDRLFKDEDVTRPKGVWAYVLDDDERHLNIRAFPKPMKDAVYKKQTNEAALAGLSNCPDCATTDGPDRERIWAESEMEADHITPWSKGGHTTIDNCRMLCKRHNRAKSDL